MNITPVWIKRLLGIAALMAAVISLMLILHKLRFGSQSLLWGRAWNFGHAPLFGVIAIIILWLLHLSVGQRLSALPKYAIAWFGTVGLGAISEYLQISSARNADLSDWVYDIVGATAFLAFYFSIDPRVSDEEKRLQGLVKVPVRIAAVLIIIGVGIPVITGAAASWYRRTSFPKMYTFDSHLEKEFIKSSRAVLEYVDPPDEWSSHNSQVAEVTFFPAKYPGLELKGPYLDWRGYKALTLDVFSRAESSVTLYLMIKDCIRASYHDRYNGEVKIHPGHNEVRIPMAEIENSPTKRLLDLSSIQVIHLFLIEPQQPMVLYFDDLLLE